MLNTILCVDDDPITLMLCKKVIAKTAFSNEIITMSNGEEALTFLMSLKTDSNLAMPELIFLDLNMPIMSGFESLKQIRDDARFKDIPVIAIYSTSATEDGIKNTFGLGANAYIVKPTDFYVLKKLLKKVIEMDWKQRLEHLEMESFIITV